MHLREQQVETAAEKAHGDTFDWVLSFDESELHCEDAEHAEMKSRFRTWISDEKAVFWVCGKAASGKSTLMRKIYHDHRLRAHLERWAPLKNITLARMFFTSEGSELQRSREGLLRSLLHQATEDESLATHVLQAYLDKLPEDQLYNTDKIQWTWLELRGAFSTLLNKASSSQRFLFFVDGLDEYNSTRTGSNFPPEYHLETDSSQGRTIRAGYRDIAQLLQTLPDNNFVKICVSSRPYNEFEDAFSKCPSFRLELLTKDDIKQYIHTEMIKCTQTETVAMYAECVEEIMTKALGVFLWVRIATDILVDGMINAISHEQLFGMLGRLPSELGGPRGLYMRILRRLDPSLLPEAWKMFDLVLSARRDLHVLSLSFAMEASPQHAVALKIGALGSDELDNRFIQMSKRLKALGGLLEAEGTKTWSYVRFLHLTAKEFLLRTDVQHIITANISHSTCDSNVTLLTGCLMQLKRLAPAVGPRLRFWRNIKDGFYYAAQAERTTGKSQTALLDSMNETAHHLWKEGCGESGSRSEEGENTFQDLATKSSCPSWVDAEPQESGGKIYEWRDDFMSLAVQANLSIYLREKFRQGYRLDDKPGRPLLAYAVVPTGLYNLEQYEHYERYLDRELGSDFSHVSMTRLLLDHGADPNAVCKPGDEEYHYTSSVWSIVPSIAQALLVAAGPRQSGPTIWQLSLVSGVRCDASNPAAPSYRNWLETMKILLEYGASPNVLVSWEAGVRKCRYTETHSALFVCLLICMKHLCCDVALPRLVMSKGGRLRVGELHEICETIRHYPEDFDKKLVFLRYFFPSVRVERPSDDDEDTRRLTANDLLTLFGAAWRRPSNARI